MSEVSKTCIQFGCGLSAPDGWLNYDASPTLRLQRLPVVGGLFEKSVKFPDGVRYGDVLKGLPHEPNTVTYAYCSHVLEHLALEELRLALKEMHRILKPRGVFRMVLPDLAELIKTYVEDGSDTAATTFMEKTHLGVKHRPKGIKGQVVAMFGNSKHLWMWDEKSLMRELEAAGFKNIRRAQFGDGPDACFTEVELQSRWDGCLGLQAEV